jgi:hypothetical protein
LENLYCNILGEKNIQNPKFFQSPLNMLRKNTLVLSFGAALTTMLFLNIAQVQQPANVFGQNNKDIIRITGDFVPYEPEYVDDTFSLTRFSFTPSNGSQICPSGGCTFQMQEGRMYLESPTEDFLFGGVLRVGDPTRSGPEGMYYGVYDTVIGLNIVGTTEGRGLVTHEVIGTVVMGEEPNRLIYKITKGAVRVGGGLLSLDINALFSSSV